MLTYAKGTREREDLIKLCSSVIRGNVHDYDKRVNQTLGCDIIGKTFREIIGNDKLDYRAMRRNNNLVLVFEIIEEVIDIKIEDGFANNPFFKAFVEYKSTKWGDRPEFYVKNPNSIVISEVSGGHWNLNRQRLNAGESFWIPTKWYSAKIYEEFERMLTGRINFVELVSKIYQSVMEKIGETIAIEFMGSFDVIPPEFKQTGTLDISKLLELTRNVATANKSVGRTIIAGTRVALDRIPELMGQSSSFLISNEMKESINNLGLLQTFRGHKILEIPQFFKQGTFETAVADDTLFILTGDEKPIKVVKEGESIIRETNNGLENQDMTLEYTFQTKVGVSTILNNYYGAYTITG